MADGERLTAVPGAVPAPSRPPDSHIDPAYRFVRRVDVRFRDVDILGHVNHVVYLTYVEQVRTEYFYELLGIQLPSGNPTAFVIATITCDYTLPLGWGYPVDVGWRFTRLGRSSADYSYEIRRGPDVASRGHGVMVNADPVAGASAPIPERWRAILAEFEGISP